MSDHKDPLEFSDVGGLEELESLHEELEPSELPDLEGLEELEELGEAAPAASPTAEKAKASGESGAGDESAGPRAKGGVREIEKAPRMLRISARILIAASVLPWLAPLGFDLRVLGAKAVILLGGYLIFNGVGLRAGERIPGALAKIGGLHVRALDGLGLLLMVVGIGLAPFIEGGASVIGALIAEEGFLAIGLFAVAQIHDYERGGKFNPVMGLIMPFAALAGAGRLATVLVTFDAVALLGSLGALGAGGLAGYTMFLAMKEAKAHGEKKRRAALAARRKPRSGAR